MSSSKKKSTSAETNSKKAGTAFPLTPLEAETLEELIGRLGIKDWDFLILGDGSGSNWNKECGWGAVSIERATLERLVWYGYANRGSVNAAEGMALLWPAMWLANREAERVEQGG